MSEIQKAFKKHYKRAMKLKEGGSAWEREITLAKKYLDMAEAEHERQLKMTQGD